MYIFAISGFSKSGKTTVVEALARAFSGKGYSVAVVKDSSCAAVIGDAPFDTGRHRAAGASASVLLFSGLTSIVYERRLSLMEALSLLNHDIVMLEGFKALRIPKIVTASDTKGADAVFCEETFAFSGRLAAAVSSYRGRPVLNCLSNAEDLAVLALKYASRCMDEVSAKAGGLY